MVSAISAKLALSRMTLTVLTPRALASCTTICPTALFAPFCRRGGSGGGCAWRRGCIPRFCLLAWTTTSPGLSATKSSSMR